MKTTLGLFLSGLLVVGALLTGCDGGPGPGAGGAGGGGGADGGGGGGTAGGGGMAAAPTCKGYCDAITANCKDANLMYTDAATCEAVCAAFELGKAGDTSGNTVGCREYHAGVAMGEP